MTLQDHADKVKDMFLSEINETANVVFNGILTDTLINKIPEPLFVNYFLPCFLGIINNDKWVMEWISIAGTPMSPVDVFDTNTNDIIYRVPSLLNTNNLFLIGNEADLSDIFIRYDQVSSNIPTQGLKFLLDALRFKNKDLLKKLSFNESNKQWEYILRRYNLIDKNTDNKDTENDDIFEY